ncbi:MAG: hypothetical protein LC754_03925 [Acidobacteria bacterium]|nr:hypothetical protein [Acidobacteriota bacterium]
MRTNEGVRVPRPGARCPRGLAYALHFRRAAMRLSELITIYLATAAPFGVAHFLRGQTLRAHDPRSLARAVGVALLWPLTAGLLLINRRAAALNIRARGDGALSTRQDERKIEQAKRALINSLRAVEDLLEQTSGLKNETERHVMFAARECVERYTGLTLAAAEAHADDAPSAREMELCRLAGRTGDDLLLAGRCTHRRNVSRLLAHRARARAEMLHALAAVRETAHTLYPKSPQFISSERPVVEALLHAFARAIELLSLLDDWQAAVSVSRLLDAECARLRLPLTGSSHDAPSDAAQGGEPCMTPTAHEAFVAPLPQTTTFKRA